MRSILYVDDEPALLEIGKIYLETEGSFTVDTIPSAREALAQLGRKNYDAIVSDYQMPGMDGIEFLKHVRASGNTVPFIVFTGRGREEVVIQALNEGADFYLQKGGEPQAQFAELSNKIRYAIDRRKAESEIREAGERYRAFISVSNTGAWEYHHDTGFMWCSPEYFSMLGRDPCQFDRPGSDNLKEAWIGLMHPDDREPAIRLFREYLQNRTGGLYENHFRMRHADGHWVWIWSRGRTIRDKNGPLTCRTIGTHIDVTSIRSAEEELKERETQLRATLESTADGILAVDNEGKVLHVSRRFAAIWKIPPELVESGDDRKLLAFVLDQLADPGAFMEKVESLYHSDAVDMDILAFRDGRVIERYSSPMMMDGKRIGRVWSFRDVTGQKQVERALRDSEDRLSTILNAAQVGIVLVDGQTHRILQANPKALSLIGAQECEVTGVVCHRFICPAEEGKCPVTDLGHVVNSSERILLTKDGVRLPIIKTVVSTCIGDREVLVESFIDISDRKRAEEALTRANAKLGLLATVTRHDIRNQLTALTGYLEIALSGGEPEKTEECIMKALAVSGVIDQQIGFTRDYETMGMKEPVWQSVALLAQKAETSIPHPGVCMEIDVPGLEVLADPLLEKVFHNLTDNAVRHGGNTLKTIRISCRREGPGLSVIFEDDGEGIPENAKRLIFDHGYGKNSGLGLFLVREILSITGMTIEESGVPCEGARFVIRVPEGAWRFAGTN